MPTRQPYYRRVRRFPNRRNADFSSTGEFIDLSNAHLASYQTGDAVPEARDLFDARAAASVSTAVAIDGRYDKGPVRIWPVVEWFRQWQDPMFQARDLLEMKAYPDSDRTDPDLAPTIYLPTAKCLSAMAYLDYFPDRQRVGHGLRAMVSAAILAASPGWCGSFGPGVDGTASLGASEGNYDMTEMHLVAIAYQYYAELSSQARERLITLLLQRGRIHRPNRDDTFTSGNAPDDWDRAGVISPIGMHKNIGETENHILMIATTRYLTNQLLYQRDGDISHDNRRNGGDGWSSCTSILVTLLRNMLRGDFSEYNAKGYQAETRWALLNLCTYAYDDEVRLGARMVLDYLSAHMAVSSNDLRRLLPFRRRNEDHNSAHDPSGFMTVGLLESRPGADPMTAYFAMQAGNTRAYEWWNWGIRDDGTRVAMEVLSDYRLPHSIHDLFVNNRHRRFFQRLHRRPRLGEMGGNRNANNMEVFASSWSYLITAGGSPSGYAIDPYFAGIVPSPSGQRQQLGVAVTTSFMPTGGQDDATELIQFSQFAEGPASIWAETMGPGLARNYGVAPDFACGHNLHLPAWAQGTYERGFLFIDGNRNVFYDRPGYYLAIFQDWGRAVLEAFDTWLRPGVSMDAFMAAVLRNNAQLKHLGDNEAFDYTTWNGNRIRAVIWTQASDRSDSEFGAEVLSVQYGDQDRTDSMGDAARVTNRLVNGTVMNSPADAVVEITNPYLSTRLTLDMSDPWHPRRADESGDIEEAGSNHEVWLNFDWPGPSEGDACRPFNTVASACGAVAHGGRVRIVPGATRERKTIGGKKRMRLVAPLGGVVIGARGQRRPPVVDAGPAEGTDEVLHDDIWVEFDFPESAAGHIVGPHHDLATAIAAVGAGRIIRVVPGRSNDRSTIGSGKAFRLVAPIGGVTLGARV